MTDRQAAISRAIATEAWDSIDLGREHSILLRRFVKWGAMTADEYETRRGRIGGAARGHQRFAEAREMGLIRQTGEKRKTRSGRRACVYGITIDGLRFLAWLKTPERSE